ncbi:glycosyltransferase family 2 protein [Cytobacillus sp.]|uniref:glycosyltransferase family 2 protein n=1 Tax=Cytobacillus sp. TaxID=2675269 RepID=UPI0028BE1302|nr:glycosyltransferase family 2 protein [Cytobacillus sp.]
MKYIVGIPYVNRLDLLQKAVESIKPYWEHTVIIDNSDGRDLKGHELSSKVQIYEPPVPLTFTQSMNYIIRLAEEKECEVWMYMHCDAEAHEGTPEALLTIVENTIKEGRKWGVIFTLYDTLAAYSMEAQKEIGYFDTIIRDYFADTDYYRRMNLAGFELISTPLSNKMNHVGSASIHSDSNRAFITTITFPQSEAYYIAKWGGPRTQEKYNTPFNHPK